MSDSMAECPSLQNQGLIIEESKEQIKDLLMNSEHLNTNREDLRGP